MAATSAYEPSMSADSAWEAFQSTTRFGNLDGLRCLSIVAVVWHHGPGIAMSGLAGAGFTGVWLFFAISGFLITTLLLREYQRTETISLRKFYARRSLRIFPLYFAVLGLYTVLIPLMAPPETTRLFLSNLPYFLTYTSNWFVGTVGTFAFAWSLAAEEQFYSTWPWVLRYLNPRRAVWAAAALLVASFLSHIRHGHPAGAAGFPLLILQSVPPAICWGCVLAFLTNSRRGFAVLWLLLGGRWSAAAVLSLILLALAGLPGSGEALNFLYAALVGACVLREDTILAPLLRHPAVAHAGVVSYGVYLLHGLVYDTGSVAVRLAGGSWEVHSVPGFVLALPVTVALATLSYRYYESIFLRLKVGFGVVRT